MKQVISFVISLVVFIILIFWVDGWLVNTIVDAFPPSATDWLNLIRIVAWVLVLWGTFGLALIISSGVYWIIKFCLDYKKIMRSYKAGKEAEGNKPSIKSKWQDRLEEMQQRQNKN